MNTHDTFARIANHLGGIPSHLEAGVKEILDKHAKHHADTAQAEVVEQLTAAPTPEELAAVRAKRTRAAKTKKR